MSKELKKDNNPPLSNEGLAAIGKRILGMALDAADKTSEIYNDTHDQELCKNEFYKGARWFSQKLNEMEYDKFSAQWVINSGKRKAVAENREGA